jgi:hypothetical protein
MSPKRLQSSAILQWGHIPEDIIFRILCSFHFLSLNLKKEEGSLC